MLIAGFQKLTLVDYPGKLAALIFTQGCNFACGYCHNAEMIPPLRVLSDDPELEPEEILDFLKRRRGLLDGVVISGGEPTLHKDLEEYIRKIKAMEFLVKLDTNGSSPETVQRFIDEDLVDFIAMDIKYSGPQYREYVKSVDFEKIKQTAKIILHSGVDYEFRSTVVPYYHDKRDICEMGKMIKGAKKWALQNFRPLKTLDKGLMKTRSFSDEELRDMKRMAEKYASLVEIRNA